MAIVHQDNVELFDQIPVGIITVDRLGHIITANLAAHELLRTDLKQLTSQRLGDLFFDGDQTAYECCWEKAVATGVSQQCELRSPEKGEELRWFQVSIGVPLKTTEQPIYTVSVYDITKVKQTAKALSDKDAMLARIASQVPGMLYQFKLKPDGTFSVPYSSNGVIEIFGCSPEAIREDFDPIFNVIHPDDQQTILDTIEESKANMSQWKCEYRVRITGEPIKWIFGNSIPEKLSDGSCVWTGYNVDITDRKQAEAEQTEFAAHLQQVQKMESIGRLAGGVAHDFNNMLNVILGFAELALQDVDASERIYGDLVEIVTAAKRSAKITGQLLTFARKQTVRLEVLDLNATVLSMFEMLERLIGENIRLNWHPGGDLWAVKMDPQQIDQILANLCINARDAIADFGEITIETANCTFDPADCSAMNGFLPGNWVRLRVCDNGRGMDQKTQEHIFEPFFTTKEQGEGTGLGLPMVYGAIRQNGGFIDVKSTLGAGTIFSIYLTRAANISPSS